MFLIFFRFEDVKIDLDPKMSENVSGHVRKISWCSQCELHKPKFPTKIRIFIFAFSWYYFRTFSYIAVTKTCLTSSSRIVLKFWHLWLSPKRLFDLQLMTGWLIYYDSERLLDSFDAYFRLYLELSLVQIFKFNFSMR